jgi:hypothetical protein
VNFCPFSFCSLFCGDPAQVADSSFIQELDKSGFIDTAWEKEPATNVGQAPP